MKPGRSTKAVLAAVGLAFFLGTLNAQAAALPKNSVGAKQIKNNAVTFAKLHKSVRGKIAANSANIKALKAQVAALTAQVNRLTGATPPSLKDIAGSYVFLSSRFSATETFVGAPTGSIDKVGKEIDTGTAVIDALGNVSITVNNTGKILDADVHHTVAAGGPFWTISAMAGGTLNGSITLGANHSFTLTINQPAPLPALTFKGYFSQNGQTGFASSAYGWNMGATKVAKSENLVMIRIK